MTVGNDSVEKERLDEFWTPGYLIVGETDVHLSDVEITLTVVERI